MKKIGGSLKWVIAGMMLLVISCRKEYSGVYTPAPPTPPQHEFQVVTTGNLYHIAAGIVEPVYWINNKKFTMEIGDRNQAIPYGVTKKGNDLYFAGGYMGLNNNKETFMPCYWINGQKINLPVTGLNVAQRCGAADLAWFNDTLFILGDVDFEAVLWKVKGNFVSVSTLPGKKVNEVTYLHGMNMQVYNDQLYFASNHYIDKGTGNGDFIIEAGYFTIDKAGKQVYHVLEGNLFDAACYSLAVSSKGLFVSGELYETPHGLNVVSKPVIWTLQGKMNVFDQLDRNKQRLNEVAVDEQGKVYANVLDYQTQKPTVWETQANAGNFESLNPILPANVKGQCDNVATLGDEVAYAYTWEENAKFFTGYVFKGKQVLMESDSSLFKALNRTSIFEK